MGFNSGFKGLMLLKKIIVIYCENLMKNRNTLSLKKTEFLNVTGNSRVNACATCLRSV